MDKIGKHGSYNGNNTLPNNFNCLPLAWTTDQNVNIIDNTTSGGQRLAITKHTTEAVTHKSITYLIEGQYYSTCRWSID